MDAQLGDTSLPAEQPEMLDDDFLQKLHHVLLEVRPHVYSSNVSDALTPRPLRFYCPSAFPSPRACANRT